MFLIQHLRLDPMENDPERAAHYATIGVTRDPAVRVYIEDQATKDVVDPEECWALRSTVAWPRPIKRWKLVPLVQVSFVSQAEVLLDRARQGLL